MICPICGMVLPDPCPRWTKVIKCLRCGREVLFVPAREGALEEFVKEYKRREDEVVETVLLRGRAR